MPRGNEKIIYPRFWLSDLPLRMCSLPARGLAVDLACFMTQTEPYGHLTGIVDGLPRLLGITEDEYASGLSELESKGAFKRTEDGVLYWPCMVQDAERRAVNVANGRRGGNPAILKRLSTEP
jgi:hypothetical protein